MKWIDFFYMRSRSTRSRRDPNAKALVASEQPVGDPALPIFDKEQYDLANTLDQAVRQRAARAR